MNRVPVISSNISEIGYDQASSILEVLFTNGTLYQYNGVPAQVHDELMVASSHGSFLNSYVKGRFPYVRLY